MTMSGNSSVMVVDKSAQLPVLADRNGLVSYFEKIKNFPVLSEDEEKALIVDFKQNHNLEAAHRLVVSHLRLAAKIALTYRHYGLPLADLISEANIGLMQAVKKLISRKKFVFPPMQFGGLRRRSTISSCGRGRWSRSVPWRRKRNCSTIWGVSKPSWAFTKTRRLNPP